MYSINELFIASQKAFNNINHKKPALTNYIKCENSQEIIYLIQNIRDKNNEIIYNNLNIDFSFNLNKNKDNLYLKLLESNLYDTDYLSVGRNYTSCRFVLQQYYFYSLDEADKFSLLIEGFEAVPEDILNYSYKRI